MLGSTRGRRISETIHVTCNMEQNTKPAIRRFFGTCYVVCDMCGGVFHCFFIGY